MVARMKWPLVTLALVLGIASVGACGDQSGSGSKANLTSSTAQSAASSFLIVRIHGDSQSDYLRRAGELQRRIGTGPLAQVFHSAATRSDVLFGEYAMVVHLRTDAAPSAVEELRQLLEQQPEVASTAASTENPCDHVTEC